MDFEYVLNIILKKFEELDDINYAVMGGFAMGISGVQRTTQDIDFLIDKKDIEKLHPHLEKIGYKRILFTENVSQYTSDNIELGFIDFIHAFREISLNMLHRSIKVPVFNGKLFINILKIEDIIGLKIQSIANDPERRTIDFADIEQLLKIHGKKVDWDLLNDYFLLFDMNKDYEGFKKEYGAFN